MSSGLDTLFAEAMLDQDEHLERYKKDLTDLREQGLLPNMSARLQYKVYSIKSSGFCAHKSIVLTTDDQHFVSVELGFIPIDGVKHTRPVARKVDKANKSKMKFLGRVVTTGDELIVKAIKAMKRFGSYFKLYNNCQDYCNIYAEEIGLKQAKTSTDRDKVVIAGIIAVIIAIVFAYT